MANYYISSLASNGYVVGSDVNNGTSKATPWLTLDIVNGAGFVWSGNDTVYINGNIVCTAYFNVDNNISFIGELNSNVKPIVTLLNGGAAANGIRFVAGKTLTVTDVDFNGSNCTTTVFAIDTNLTGGLTLLRVSYSFKLWGIFSSVGCPLLSITDCEAIEVDATSTGAAIYVINCVSGDTITINGLKLQLTGLYASGRGGIIIEGNHATTICNISRVTGNIINSASTGYTMGVYISDIGIASIFDCDLTLQTSTTATGGSLYTIINPNILGSTVTPPKIYNNYGGCLSREGIIIGIGHDSYGVGANKGKIYNNNVWGPSNVGGLHGIFLLGGDNSEVYNNCVRNVAIGYISKETLGGVLSHNVAEFIKGTAAYYLKGAKDCMVTGNMHIISSTSPTKSFYVTANTTTMSTGFVFAGNSVFGYSGIDAPVNIVDTGDTDQIGKFYGNDYFYENGLSSNFNAGGSLKTLSEWQVLTNVFGDQSFRFNPRFAGKQDHRIMKIVK